MSEFEEFEHPSWMTRSSACAYFGLTDDDEGWDRLNEIVDEFDIDCEIGAVGDVLRVNANDPGVREALFTRHEREVGHRPDHPERVAEARGHLMASERSEQTHRAGERSRLRARVSQRKSKPIRRIEE